MKIRSSFCQSLSRAEKVNLQTNEIEGDASNSLVSEKNSTPTQPQLKRTYEEDFFHALFPV